MIKNVICFCLLLVFNSSLLAQEPVVIGFKGGLNISSFVGGDVVDNDDIRVGFHAGFLTEFYLNRNFGIQAEVMFSEQGISFVPEDTDEDFDEIKYNLNYVNLPVLVKYYATDDLCVEFGPQIGINISAKKESIGGRVGSGSETEKMDFVNLLDFGGAIGLSYKFDLGLYVQARYVLGITPIFTFDDEASDVRHSNGQIAAGFRF